MALGEEIVVPAGHRLIVGELTEGTRRDVACPLRWGGLGREDAALLERFVESLGVGCRCLHTDVRVGVVPDSAEIDRDPLIRSQVAALHPLRIDACIETEAGWMLCEVKPDAGYVAMGQVLTYVYYAQRTCDCLRDCTGVVVTDRMQAALRPVYDHFDVGCVEVG
jgi:hypothetical protein